MTKRIVCEVRVGSGLDADLVERSIREEIEADSGLRVEDFRRERPFGMTAGDIVISFVVSAAGSALVHVYRDQIDRAVENAGLKLKAALTLMFGNGDDFSRPDDAP